MLYSLYGLHRAALAPLHVAADISMTVFGHRLSPLAHLPMGRMIAAGAEVVESAMRRRGKPAWNIDSAAVDGERTPVEPRAVQETPFCKLMHFRRGAGAANRGHPKVLLVAPMSGHHATLLRGTVESLLPAHDVFITDWNDARDVPLAAGRFGLDEYVDHLLDFMRRLGPGLNVVAVCQPAPLVLAAAALLAQANDRAQPASLVLMGGPVDTRANRTIAAYLAENRPPEWFRRHVVTAVTPQYKGAGRRVYPGFVQLTAFMSMHPARHLGAHWSMFRHLVRGDGDSAAAHRRFYDEYLSVMDIPAEFYLESVDVVFRRHLLPRGQFEWRGQRADPAAIRRTGLMTVEGALDDVSAPGQTHAAHALCPNVPAARRAHHLQDGVGHYGIYNGRRWREEILPRVSAFMRANEPAPARLMRRLTGR